MFQRKLIINFAPTGMVASKKANPNIPTQPNEIIEQIHEVYDLGITLVHVHARDKYDNACHKASSYQPIVEGIRRHCPGLPICVSLSGRSVNSFETRSEVLSLKPDMASLTLSSLNFRDQASVNSPEMINQLAQAIYDHGAVPELEVFDVGMMNYSQYLIGRGVLKPPFYFNFILGNIAGIQPELDQLGALTRLLPTTESYWAVGGIGNYQQKSNLLAMAMGGGVRVGLEDNLYYDKNRTILATNIDLIKRIHSLAQLQEYDIMSPSEFGNLGFYNKIR